MGFDCIMNAPLLQSCCGCFSVFGSRISFLSVDGYSAVSCDFGVFIIEGELRFRRTSSCGDLSKFAFYKFVLLSDL